MQRKVEKQNIPFLDDRNIFTVLFRQKKLPELAPLRQTCRIANQQFNHALFENPLGMLQKLDQLTFAQVRKFLENNAAHAESLLPLVDDYDSAYASYTLLGDVGKLDPDRLLDVIVYMREQKVQKLWINYVELIHAIYDSSENDNRYFQLMLDRLARKYLHIMAFVPLRPIFLYFLLRTMRLIELDDKRDVELRYGQVKELLKIAGDHDLFASKPDFSGRFFKLFQIDDNAKTTSEEIAKEVFEVETRYTDLTRKMKCGG